MRKILRGLFKRIIQRFNHAEKVQFKVGKFTYGHESISTIGLEQNSLEIGNFCSIAGGLTVFLAGNHPLNQISTYPFGLTDSMVGWKSKGYIASNQNLSKGPVTIGSDVWIGTNVTIMSGVSIGHGAVIAANSHVVKDVPPYAIYGGNPAKIIRFRFTDNQIEKLLSIKWWEWDDEIIQKAQSILSSPLNGNTLEKLEALID
jgi:acetyltransferase-like isoleucine patch superfamily enzyme